jgi:Tol biopolymer transport system component
MKQTLRCGLFIVLGLTLLGQGCQRPRSTPASSQNVEAPPERQTGIAEGFHRVVSIKPWIEPTEADPGGIAALTRHMGMAPWRIVREGAKEKLVVAERVPAYEGKLYDTVVLGSVRTAGGLKHIAYLVQDGGKWFVVVDQREEPAFDGIAYDTIILSPDGTRVAYAVNTSVAGVNIREWVVDGKKLPESTQLRDVTFSPDGKRLAYHITTDKGKTRLYVDGEVAVSYDMATLEHLTFSSDSRGVLYVLCGQGGRKCAVIDGKEGPVFEQIKWNYPGWEQAFFFSPDPKRVAYVGQRKGQDILVVDQVPGEPLGEAKIWNLKFSPDSKHLAAMAGRSYEDQFVIADGIRSTPRGRVIFDSITFSPDGRYVAYMTSVEGGWTVVVNDTAGTVYEKLGIAERPPLQFISADGLQYVAAKGNERFVVEERLVPQETGRRVGATR